MILKYNDWLNENHLNESTTLSQFGISDAVKFDLKDKYNLDFDLTFDSLSKIKDKSTFKEYLEENKEPNLLFAVSPQNNQYLFIFKDYVVEKEERIRIIMFDNEKVILDQVNTINEIKKLLNDQYSWFVNDQNRLWINSNDKDIRKNLNVVSEFLSDTFAQFDIYLEKYYKDQKDQIRKGLEEKLIDFNESGINRYSERFKEMENFKDEKKLFDRLDQKDKIFSMLVNWLKENYKEIKYNESVIYIGWKLNELKEDKVSSDLIKDFVFYIVKKLKI